MAGYFSELRGSNAGIHHCTLNHRAVRGIGDGSLGDDRFQFYLEQDFTFLREYVRVIARAVAAADEMNDVIWLVDLLRGTVDVELDAVRRLHTSFGGNPRTLDDVAAEPACRAYTDHLLACAGSDILIVILASLLPCQWGYREIARAIEARGLPDDARYQAWVQEYLSSDYGLVVDTMIVTLDREACRAGQALREQASAAFAASAEYERRFWDMVVSHSPEAKSSRH